MYESDFLNIPTEHCPAPSLPTQGRIQRHPRLGGQMAEPMEPIQNHIVVLYIYIYIKCGWYINVFTHCEIENIAKHIH